MVDKSKPQADTPGPSLWQKSKPYRRGAVFAAVGLNIVYQLNRQWQAWKSYVNLPESFFLETDLEQNVLVERSSSSPLSILRAASGREVELHRLIKVLQTAKGDERVRGLLAILGDRSNFGGMAQLQELRNALLDFRFHVSGRAPVFAYSNAFCEGGMNGTGVYYLASAADKVFMPPTGMLALLGFASSQVFVKGLLDKLKVQPEVFRREEYKSALAPLTGTGYDAAHRQNLESLLGCLYQQVVQGIASARRLTPAEVESSINDSPLLASQALQLKLVDGLAYRDQVEATLLATLPAAAQQAHQALYQEPTDTSRSYPIAAAHRARLLKGPRVSLHRYSLAMEWEKSLQEFWGAPQSSSSSSSSGASATAVSLPQQEQQQQPEDVSSRSALTAPAAEQAAGSSSSTMLSGSAVGRPVPPQNRPIVAVVTAAGAIMQSAGPDTGREVVASNKLVRVLRSYRENPQVKAVVLRINSPGGSAVASDMIAREVQLLKDAGKPVVACMGDVAASGGYFIAAPCNKILTQPGTITGSIGVIFMKLVLRDALQEYGVTADSISMGDNADWASALNSLTPKQQQQVEGQISATYDDFLSVVAKGRGMSKEAVRQVAKGRVWSGSQAMEVGLVDEVGGLARATEVAKQLAGLPTDPAATITAEWPPSRVPPIVKLLQAAGGMDEAPLEASAAAAPLWPPILSSTAIMQDICVRAAAAAELASLFWRHAAEPSWITWLPQAFTQPIAAQMEARQQPWQLHATLAVADAAGVQQQLGSVMSYLAQPHHQPEMYCLDAELLACSC